MATLSNTDLRNGTVFKDGNDVYSVLRYESKVRGRGSSIVKVKVRNLNSGNILEKSYRANETVESIDTRRATVQYLYFDHEGGHFMDTESFEQFVMSAESLEDSKPYLKEGQKVVVLFLEDKPVAVEIPKVVELKITHTEPAVKGNTANNPTKKAKLENGLSVDVPMFSKVGDVIKVNTDSGDYVSRVK